MNYKTPGVFVEEESLLPPSVAAVATAVPAFIGYTEQARDAEGNDVFRTPIRITSMLEYETHFGGPAAQGFEITLSDEAPHMPESIDFADGERPYLMHQALQMFYANGGGPCYIVSVGDFDADDTGQPSLDAISDFDEIEAGINKIRTVDEVTLIVVPEASRLMANTQYDVYTTILAQCGDLKDRFGIFDVRSDDTDASSFRSAIGTKDLSYGAAYYPHLHTTIPYHHSDSGVQFKHGASDTFNNLTLDDLTLLSEVLNYHSQVQQAKNEVDTAESDAGSSSVLKPEKHQLLKHAFGYTEKALASTKSAVDLLESPPASSESDIEDAEALRDDAAPIVNNQTASITVSDITDALTDLKNAVDGLKSLMDNVRSGANSETGIGASHNSNIADYFTNAFTAEVRRMLADQRMTLPPSPAIAGIYARVDADRGVWKAPANVSINRVSGPSEKLTHAENGDFNVDTSGKSINVIRAFTGKGTLVWGARTLDGNSSEWKYVPVRRFYAMVEESVKKATEPFVFESNNANTWVKIKAMIENFLTVQWRAGALMGAKPEQAFFVKVGLGETMTQQHVLNGEMIIEIGMAAVRPAEFIILRFSHKMIES